MHNRAELCLWISGIIMVFLLGGLGLRWLNNILMLNMCLKEEQGTNITWSASVQCADFSPRACGAEIIVESILLTSLIVTFSILVAKKYRQCSSGSSFPSKKHHFCNYCKVNNIAIGTKYQDCTTVTIPIEEDAKSMDANGKLLEIDPDSALFNFNCKLIEDTWKDSATGCGYDAQGLHHSSIAIRNVYQIINKPLAERYDSIYHEREALFSMPSELQVHGFATEKATLNDEETFLSDKNTTNAGDPLLHELSFQEGYLRQGEVYLLHGTPVQNIPGIICNGFDLSKSKRALFGQAVYFAENSQKADQYADRSRHKTDRQWYNLCMVVTRVCLGRVETHESNTSGDVDDDILGDLGMLMPDTVVAGKGKRFREFLKYDTRQCYPEFLITYDRN